MTAPRRHDPFAPPLPVFPRERLLRAGLEDEAVETLAERYSDLGYRRQRELVAFVTRSTDARIRERFTEPEAPTLEERRAALEQLKGDELRDLLRAQNLPTGGKNAELIDRLLADNQPPAGGTPDSSAGQEGGGGEQQPPAEGSPEGSAPAAEPAAPGEGTQAPAEQPGAQQSEPVLDAIVGDGAAAEPIAPEEPGQPGVVVDAQGVEHVGELPAESAQAGPETPAGAPAPAEGSPAAPAPADGATQTPAADPGAGQAAPTEES